MTTPPPDPDPARTPDLEAGGGVSPGATPPESAQTSGLSASEPRTRKGFPAAGIGTLVAVAVIVIILVIVIVALIV
ncbi:DUF6480 family protein [Rhodococcus sp. NPDC003318]|uniref:DUF6480 family protein n=1 Tax=Rhodococcus sp. NPDC003318 TaxID=3364503 RepID=UPI0036C2F830